MSFFKKITVGAFIGFSLFALPIFVLAQNTGTLNTNTGTFNTNTGTINTNTGTCTGTGSGCSIQNPLQVTSICGLLQKLLQAITAIAIPIAVVFIIWSGFQFVLAQGNSSKLDKAKRNFYYTVIGLAIFLGAWLLASVIASTVNAIAGYQILSCS